MALMAMEVSNILILAIGHHNTDLNSQALIPVTLVFPESMKSVPPTMYWIAVCMDDWERVGNGLCVRALMTVMKYMWS